MNRAAGIEVQILCGNDSKRTKLVDRTSLSTEQAVIAGNILTGQFVEMSPGVGWGAQMNSQIQINLAFPSDIAKMSYLVM